MDRALEQPMEGFIVERLREMDRVRAAHVERLELMLLLQRRNPYLDRVRQRGLVADVINALLDGSTASVDEDLFDGFLRELAIFVSGRKFGGRKSKIPGVDIELERDGVQYLIAVKSAKVWGNRYPKANLRNSFSNAIWTPQHSSAVGRIQPTLGTFYGGLKKKNNRAYLHVQGKDFWELISGEADLYKDIVESIGHRAREFDEAFYPKRIHAINRMTLEFIRRFCMADGSIDWPRIVTLVSKNA